MNSRFLGGLCAIAAFGLDQGTAVLKAVNGGDKTGHVAAQK